MMRSQTKDQKRSSRLSGLILCLLLLGPGSAEAFTFSFGGSIAASDVISSITLAADDGSGGSTFVFDTSTNTISFTSSVSQINFTNRASITGIPTGKLSFTSVVSLNGSFVFAGNTFTAGDFTNGAADFTIWDDPGGATVKFLEGEYQGDGLLVTIRAQAGTAIGEISGDYTITGGAADVVAAHGPSGSLDQVFTVGTLVGSNPFPSLCGIVVQNTSSPQCLGGPNDWLDFEANPTSTLIPDAIVPEPGSALLIGLGLAGLAACRRG